MLPGLAGKHTGYLVVQQAALVDDRAIEDIPAGAVTNHDKNCYGDSDGGSDSITKDDNDAGKLTASHSSARRPCT